MSDYTQAQEIINKPVSTLELLMLLSNNDLQYCLMDEIKEDEQNEY
jgi:hypothetical protein